MFCLHPTDTKRNFFPRSLNPSKSYEEVDVEERRRRNGTANSAQHRRRNVNNVKVETSTLIMIYKGWPKVSLY